MLMGAHALMGTVCSNVTAISRGSEQTAAASARRQILDVASTALFEMSDALWIHTAKNGRLALFRSRLVSTVDQCA